MEAIAFVLWMVFYPITVSLSSYLNAKKRKLLNDTEPLSKTGLAIDTLLNFGLWISVGIYLFDRIVNL